LIFLKLISLASRSSSPTLSPAELNLYTRTGTFLDSVASSAAGLDGFDENLLIKISSDVHAARKLLSLSSFASSANASLFVGRMFNEAKRKHEQSFAESRRAINEKVRLCVRVGHALIDARQKGWRRSTRCGP